MKKLQFIMILLLSANVLFAQTNNKKLNEKSFHLVTVNYTCTSQTDVVFGKVSKSGVYLSLDDFENHRLSYAGKIQFHKFFEKPYITINYNGKKTRLLKDEIFAYRNRNGQVVHTWNKVPYTFSEQGKIWVYYRDQNVSKGKGIRRERRYFFSLTGKGEIIPLTIINLKKSFPDNHLFHDLLNTQFQYEAELTTYDSFEKKLKVNHLLETTIFLNTKN